MFFVVVEGVDGIGKSSLVEAIKGHIACIQPTIPSSRLRRYKQWVDRFASNHAHYLFYKKCVKDLSQEVMSYADSENLVIVDRYWYSTIATHRTLGVECLPGEFAGLAIPDLILFLTADESAQRQRMISRGLDLNDHRMLGKNKELTEHFKKVLPNNTRVIDTTNLSIEMLSDIILGKLKNMVGGLR